MSSSTLKIILFLEILALKDSTCKNFPSKKKTFSPQAAFGGKVPVCFDLSCCVVDFIFTRLRSVVGSNKTRQQSDSCFFLLFSWQRNFVVLHLPPRPPSECFVVVLFSRIFFIIVLLCFPFLRLRSDTTKSELKKSSSRFFPQL